MQWFSFFVYWAICFSSYAAAAENTLPQARFKLYCMYTPQFQSLYEQYFLPSIKDDFEVVVREYPQECSSGTFRSDGWDKTMLRKLDLLLDAIKENWGDQVFVYSDIDIIFLRPVLEAVLSCLADNDFVVQQSWPRKALCAGFFVMKGNERTLELITRAHDLLEQKKSVDDQLAIEAALKSFEPGEISWQFLPSEQFSTGRRVLKNYVSRHEGAYSFDSDIVLDSSILLFHASCCIGLINKYHFLTRVQEEFLRTTSLNVTEN